MDSIERLQKIFADDRLIFAHKGEVNHQLLLAICRLAEVEMDLTSEVFYMKKRVVHLIIECLQNIIKHNSLPEDSAAAAQFKPTFMFGKEDDRYLLASGNTLLNHKAHHLENYLNYLNSLNPYRLQKFYKGAIKSVVRWGKKGRMGLVEMAIKSHDKIDFSFEPIDEQYCYFTYLISIRRDPHILANAENLRSSWEAETAKKIQEGENATSEVPPTKN